MFHAGKKIVRSIIGLTPYDIVRRRPPPVTLDASILAISYAFSARPGGTLLQIGAFDGVSNDPVHQFLQTGKAKAILVEPIPHNFRRLEATYAGLKEVCLVEAAIAHQDGNATIYRVKNEGRWHDNEWVGQISSFKIQHLLKHGIGRDEIEEITVNTISLGTLLSNYQLNAVDFLQIDTEGFDAEVVRMALALPTTPDFINFEHRHLVKHEADDLFRQLERHGYLWVRGEYDTLAVKASAIVGPVTETD